MATQKQILTLYKNLLEKAYKFDNYNFREYAKRKILHSFRDNKSLKNEEEINNFYNEGLKDLGMLNRQSTISQMFTFEKLVVEPLKKTA